RLEECVDVIRRLLAGETVSHDGLIRVHEAQIWERADPVPQLLGPAITVESAGRVAAWAEGLITLNQPIEVLRDLLAAYRGAGGTGPAALQVHLSWAPTEAEAERIAHDQWRSNVFDEPVDSDTAQPAAFDIMSEHVGPEAVRE